MKAAARCAFLFRWGLCAARRCAFCGEGRLPQRPQTVYAQLFCEKGVAFRKTIRACASTGGFRQAGSVWTAVFPASSSAACCLRCPCWGAQAPSACARRLKAAVMCSLRAAPWRRLVCRLCGRTKIHFLLKKNKNIQIVIMRWRAMPLRRPFFGVLGAVRGGVQLAGLRPGSAQGDMAFLPLLRQAGAAMCRRRAAPCGLSRPGFAAARPALPIAGPWPHSDGWGCSAKNGLCAGMPSACA